MAKLQQPVIDEILRRKKTINNSSLYIPWIVLNACVAVLIYVDICEGSLSASFTWLPSWIVFVECLLLAVFALNVFFDLACYLFPLIGKVPIKLTMSQKTLFGIDNTYSRFLSEPPAEKKKEESQLPNTSSIIDSFCLSRLSFRSNSPFSTLSKRNASEFSLDANSTLSSPNRSVTSDSWTYRTSPNIPDAPMRANSSLSPGNLSSLSLSQHQIARWKKTPSDSAQKFNSSYISDEQSLDQYLRDYEEKEQISPRDISTSHSPSFWSYSRSPVDYTSQLMKNQYQIASRSPQSSTSHKDDVDSPTKYCNEEVWKRFGVSPEELDVWMERLRKWIAQTVIIDSVNQINDVNKVLSNSRPRTFAIGEVSISTLGQIAFNSGTQIPHLSTLLPFLDCTANQEYLVHRLKSLASGSCMSAFKWNGGGTFKGKPWDEHLPTDSMIVMHQLCSYLDAMTPFHPNFPDGRTFTSQYFVKTPDKPDSKKKDCLYIYQSQINPPIYKLVTGEVTYELPEGRNNMFQVILLFLHHTQKYHAGMLGRLSLGKSGVNMLCILDS